LNLRSVYGKLIEVIKNLAVSLQIASVRSKGATRGG